MCVCVCVSLLSIIESTELADFTILNSCKGASGKYKSFGGEQESERASKRKLIQEEIMQVKK